MMSFIFSIIKTCVHILYPNVCISCGKFGTVLCGNCRKHYLQTNTITPNGFYGCASYSDVLLRSLIVTLKQKPSSDIAQVCAILIHNRIIHIIRESNITTISVVPLPRTRKKIQKIGHDQMNIIGNELVNILNQKKFSSSLYAKTLKNTNTLEHHTLTKTERIIASQSQFVFNKERPPKNSLVILCDDIITSGSTMRAAQELFTCEGYSTIICVSLLIKE